MQDDLENKLISDYPSLYSSQPFTDYGFACGPGWFTIIDTISELLSHDKTIKVSQVKEKLGGLRYHFDGGDDYASGVSMIAEMISMGTCETCGSPGARYKDRWITTKCDAHKPCDEANQIDIDVSSIEYMGLGFGWSLIIKILLNSVEFYTAHAAMPVAIITPVKDGDQLHVEFSGGNEMTSGMVDFVNHYAKRIDEHSGRPIDHPQFTML